LRNRWFWIVSLALLLSILLVILLWPEPIQTTPVGEALANWAANLLQGSDQSKPELLAQLEVWLNFLLFIPFSMVVFFASKSRRMTFALLGSLLLSGGAELTQKFLLVERVATVQDVLLNSAGALVGTGLAWLISRVGRKSQTSRLS